MSSFSMAIRETDLWVAVGGHTPEVEPVSKDFQNEFATFVWRQRRLLEEYIAQFPFFGETFEPCLASPGAPPIVLLMVRAGNIAGVGPMAAVAGAFAQLAGVWLLRKYPQVIVENGGDLFVFCLHRVKVGIYAGSSLFSGKLAVRLKPGGPWGLCTSSGTVGPSFSHGRADAAVILAKDALLADAIATATGNLVQSTADLGNAVDFAKKLPGVEGVLVIKDDKMAVWGDMHLEEI
jgi:ApbE superfamily uncharacterized protein (UPF0280 family)